MNPNPSTPVKLAQKVGRSRPAEPAPQAVVESPAPEGKKLSLGGIIASVVVGLAVGIAALLTGATLVLAGGIFIGAVLILLAFLSGTITMSSLMSEQQEEEPEGDESHMDDHHSGYYSGDEHHDY